MIEAVRQMRQHMRHFAETHCPRHRMRQASNTASASGPENESHVHSLERPSATSNVASIPTAIDQHAIALPLPSEFHAHDDSPQSQALDGRHTHQHHTTISLFPVALIAGVGGVAFPPAWAAPSSSAPRDRHNSFRSPPALLSEEQYSSQARTPLLGAILAATGEPHLHSYSTSRSRVQSSSVDIDDRKPSSPSSLPKVQSDSDALLLPLPANPTERAPTFTDFGASTNTSSIPTTFPSTSTQLAVAPPVPLQLGAHDVSSSALPSQEVGGALHCAPEHAADSNASLCGLDGFGAMSASPSVSASSATKPKSSSKRSSRRGPASRFWARASSSSSSASDADSADEAVVKSHQKSYSPAPVSDDDVVFERRAGQQAVESAASRAPRRRHRMETEPASESSSAPSASKSASSEDESCESDTDSLLEELGVRLGSHPQPQMAALTAAPPARALTLALAPKKPVQTMQQRLSQLIERFYAELHNLRGMRMPFPSHEELVPVEVEVEVGDTRVLQSALHFSVSLLAVNSEPITLVYYVYL